MKLLICGDTVPTAASAPLFASGDIKSLFGGVLNVFKNSDRVIVNLECALTDSDGAIRKFGPNLKGPVETAKTLASAGVTDCALANNHMLDFGVHGFHDMLHLLDEAGLNWFGAGENAEEAKKAFYIDAEGKKIALLNFNEHEYTYALEDQPGAAPFDAFDAMARIAEVKKTADYVIVIYHGGKEYCEYPSPRLRQLCQAMVRLGADVVLCQHSHIIGCCEQFNGSEIVYGTGNFHFVKYADKEFWGKGLMTQLTIGDKIDIDYIPVKAGECGIDLMDDADAQQTLREFALRSERLHDGTWKDGWHDFVMANKNGYLETVRKALSEPDTPINEERMAHYLDCEAHLDMLMELFQTWHKTKTDGAAEE